MEVTKLKTNKFKTNLCALFITVPLNKETVTKNALLVSVLRRGTKKLNTQEDIAKKLEGMYGAGFNCGVDKIGNYQTLKFYLETIDNSYTFEKENLLQDGVDLLLEIVFDPLIENGTFKKEYVEQEKENLAKIISSRQDNKTLYAKDRCIEEMFENEPYSLYKYGMLDKIKELNETNLYKYYQELIKNSKIDLYISGENIDDVKLPDIKSSKLNNITIKHNAHTKPKVVKENLDVTQGKLIIGLNTPEENKAVVSMYNTILGGGANSKLFQNVREKASLAYSASSSYIRRQNTILIRTGIEIENYDKALEIIKKQLQEMKDGNISDDEFNAAKELIISSVNLIPESAEDMIAYYFDQRIFGDDLKITEYEEKLKNVTKEQVIEASQKVSIDTIYFLKKGE